MTLIVAGYANGVKYGEICQKISSIIVKSFEANYAIWRPNGGDGAESQEVY
jgi:hypothetical protein